MTHVIAQLLAMTLSERVILGALESVYFTVDHLEHNKSRSTPSSWASNRNFFSDKNGLLEAVCKTSMG